MSETGKRYRLTANKSKLYALAKSLHPDITPMKKTEFVKYFRSRSYALDFHRKNDDRYYHLFLSVCGGRPTIGEEITFYDENGERHSDWDARALTPDELRDFGLLEAVAVC